MNNKKGSGASAGSLKGKGFYIVLFLCAAVIGVSAWILLTDEGTNVEDAETAEAVQADVSDAVVTTVPAGTEPETETDVEAAAVQDEADTLEADAQTQETAETAETTETETQAVFSEGTTGYVWPVQGDIEVTYSIQTLLYDATMADWRTHDGIDVACDLGTPVLAAADGLVVGVRADDLYGTVVEIDHSNGVHSVYANLAAAPTVAEGDTVTMGQVIGSVGDTALGETNEVSHLHFAMTYDGLSANPLDYLPGDE